jgi:hypothetical protein
MIIEKGLSVGDVITIKLSSGEEVIAKLVEENDIYIKVSKPRVLTSAQGGIGLAPYLFTVDPDKDIKMYRASIVVIEISESDYASQYISGTTGIQLV